MANVYENLARRKIMSKTKIWISNKFYFLDNRIFFFFLDLKYHNKQVIVFNRGKNKIQTTYWKRL